MFASRMGFSNEKSSDQARLHINSYRVGRMREHPCASNEVSSKARTRFLLCMQEGTSASAWLIPEA
jgi:hypothetical protein